jgi:hypothetical protein
MASEKEINNHGRLSRNSSVVMLQVIAHLNFVLRTDKANCMQFTGFPHVVGYVENAGTV